MRVQKAEIEQYKAYLKDNHRPPSRGGNTRISYRHVITIAGETYSFLAAWSGKCVYKGERASFDWEWDESRRYRNVDVQSVVAWMRGGERVIRGSRAGKRWRTATTHLSGRRSEWED